MALKNYTDHLNISTENLDLYDNRFIIKDIIDSATGMSLG